MNNYKNMIHKPLPILLAEMSDKIDALTLEVKELKAIQSIPKIDEALIGEIIKKQ